MAQSEPRFTLEDTPNGPDVVDTETGARAGFITRSIAEGFARNLNRGDPKGIINDVIWLTP